MEKSLADQKTELRSRHHSLRLSLASEERHYWDQAIKRQIMGLPAVSGASTVFIYLSRNGEVSTKDLVQTFLHQEKAVLVPSPDIRALPSDGLFKLCFSPWLLNPVNPVRCFESSADQIDVVFVPGIVWDRDGYRIGFGGGYFDRLLQSIRPDCLKVGLAYDTQLEETVPREVWDQAVDLLITPSRVYKNRGSAPLKEKL